MTRTTDLYCLIGDPVSHSLSSAMHNSAFSRLDIDAVYTTMLVKPNEVGKSISTLRVLGAKGINVTMPHKKAVIEYLDEIDDEAGRIGAVNTIINRKGRLIGCNTDSVGAVNAITDRIDSVKGKTAVILGRGGAARAVYFGLTKEGMKAVMLNRDEMSESNLGRLVSDADLICNCTPVGMDGKSSPFPDKFLRDGLAVFDAVYAHSETPLISAAKKRHCVAIGGEEMLINQGIATFELWTNRKPDKPLMLNAIRRARKERLEKSRRNVYLVGFMGTGKSKVGNRLATKLKMGFVDTDLEIVKKCGNSINTIFEHFGEEWFRKMESSEIDAASKKRGAVVSCGGGATLDFTNIQRMRESGTVVLLKAETESILRRLNGGESRPLLLDSLGKVQLKAVKRLVESRDPYYTLARDLEVTTDDKTVDQVVDEVIGSIGDVS